MMGSNRPRDFAMDEESGRDTEVTLGPVLMVLLSCGLLLLCGTCFGAGYLMGRRSAPHADTPTVPSVNGQQLVPAPMANTATKPAAGGPGSAPAAQSPAGEPSPAPESGDAEPDDGNPVPGETGAAQSARVPQPQSPSAGARTPAGGLMVQIAAVSHPEDAEVLMNALRRRGYAVTARRVPGDSLIHVQIGPYTSRADANAMAQRLLGDGYNAVVQP